MKLANVVSGSKPIARARYRSVKRSISLAIGECDHAASCGLYSATSVSATIDACETLGLKSPKYRGCATWTEQRPNSSDTCFVRSASAIGGSKSPNRDSTS